MPEDRALEADEDERDTQVARLGLALALGWLGVVTVVNLLLPPEIVPDALYGLAALAACAVCSVRTTGVIAGLAVVLTVLSGFYNDAWGEVQQWLRLLNVVLVGAAALTLAVVRIFRRERFRRIRSIAEAAQRAILPTLPDEVAGVRVVARYHSAAEDAMVGGDLYDCSLVDGRIRFLIGDVRGKGIEAIEQAARVIRAFRQSAAHVEDLAEVARDMDAYLAPFLDDEGFVTALLVDVTDECQLVLAGCGHPPPLMARADGTGGLVDVPPGLPLGLGGALGTTAVPWRGGDRLLLYTDGVSEARDARGEFLPLDRLSAVVATTPFEVTLETILEQVRAHVPDGQPGDDQAVVLLENTGPS